MKHLVYILALFLIAQTGWAQKEKPMTMAKEDIPTDPRVRMGTLDNGLTYYIQHNEKPEDRVELRLAVKTGSVMEDEDQLGLAHFVEHMAFNGTENFEKNELVDFLESIGTRFGPDLNAYTSFDETVYMLQLRTDDQEILDKGLTVIEDWAGGLMFNPEEIDKERGVVISEWRTRLSANQRMSQEYYPVIYHESRYADRLPIGDPEIIENADYETVERFYDDWYRPNLMAVVIVGDVDVDKMEMEVKKRFGDLENPKDERPREQYDVPRHKETLVSIASDEEATFTQVRLMYKHDHQPVNDLSDYRDGMIRNLYNRMLNARLDELGQSPNPPFLFAYSGYSRDIGDIDSYTSVASTAEGDALKGLNALLVENERALRHGFTGTEMERAKEEMLTGAERNYKEQDKTESGRLAMRYVYHFLDDNPIPSPKQTYELYREMLPGISLEEVNALPNEWITDENRVVVVTGPKKENVPLPTEQEIRDMLNKVGSMEIMPYEDEVSDAPLLDKMLKPAGISSISMMDEIGVTEIELSNGVTVVLKPTEFKNDEILMQATSYGGHSLYDLDVYPSASNATSVVNESGVGEFDNIQLQKKLSGKTVNVFPYIGETTEGMRGSASPEDVKEMFELIYLYFTSPRKDEEAFSSFITKQKAIYSNLMSNPNYYFYDKATKIKFNNHPRRGFPTVEEMEAIDLDEAMRVYKDRFADASDFTFFFVGNFNVEEIKPMIATYLGNLPSTNRKESWKDVGVEYAEGKIHEEFSRGMAPRTQVDITFHGDSEWNQNTRYAMRSLMDVMSIKLRESMREDKGGVYGVRVGGNISRIPDEEFSINISFNSDPEMTEELIETAMTDIRNVMENGVEEKYLTKVRETQKQAMIKDLKENRFWISQLEFAYENGLNPMNIKLEKLEKMQSKLDSKMIQNAANQYFDFDNMITIIMHPEEVPEEEPQGSIDN